VTAARRLALGLAAAAFGAVGTANAADVAVDAQTAAQGYEVVSPWGDNVIERRRLMQTLGLAVYNLQGDYEPGQADYSVQLKLRLNADFGINGHVPGSGETSYDDGLGTHYVPGLEEYPLDLMYAYVEGRNLAGGWLGFRVGRQYVSDMLGWWSFDGGLVRVTTPFWFAAEVYGGFEQRGGLPLSTGRFERQGVWRGSHRDFNQAPVAPTSTTTPPTSMRSRRRRSASPSRAPACRGVTPGSIIVASTTPVARSPSSSPIPPGVIACPKGCASRRSASAGRRTRTSPASAA
jgi:hypothetical protein